MRRTIFRGARRIAVALTVVAFLRVPSPASAQGRSPAQSRSESRDWWAYRPLTRPAAPSVRAASWVRSPIDAFVWAKLDEVGLRPAPPADRVALARRAFYDLTGLPPTPADVDAFLADGSPDAFERLVERLLQSPQYGERWGRHWLDLVRYAETNGYERDGTKPYAWRYRDYVVRAFNQDKPFDQFLREQLAGDEFAEPTADSIIATGFYRLGLWDDEPADPDLARYDELDDIVTTTGQVFLGMTVNCARCHDHKADPISQQDYYRLLAFFQDIPRYGSRRLSEDSALTEITRLVASPAERQRIAALAERDEQLRGRIGAIETAAEARQPAPQRPIAAPRPRRSDGLNEKLRPYLSDEEWRRYGDLVRQQSDVQSELQRLRQWALSVNHAELNPPETRVLVRGNPHVPAAKVEPGFPCVLGMPDPVIPPLGARSGGGGAGESGIRRTAGRRRLLADWIASPDNPLTARVLANRLWQHHFGRGIVRTANDFGRLGEPPTHPELLDWLATELIASGWRLQAMHRLIMRSSVYQMSSRDDPAGLRIDPANDRFWRFDMRRLSAEELRDSVLAVAGTLNLKMGGPSIYTEMPRAVLETASRPDQVWGQSPPEERARRSIYVFVKRSLVEPTLAAFDLADTDASCPVRFATTVPTQSLTSLNSEFFQEQARVLAARLRREAGGDPCDQVRLGLRLTTWRPPNEAEIERVLALLGDLRNRHGQTADAALQSACLMLLNLNEFVYLD
jgi:hypothetical protein